MNDLEGILLCDGLEDALVGVSYRFNQPPIAVYDIEKIVAITPSKTLHCVCGVFFFYY